VVDQVQIFISYARKDDLGKADDPKSVGIVTALHKAIEAILLRLGEPTPRVWRDRLRIEKANFFDIEIQQAISASQLLVVVLSRNWISSPNCRKELDLFLHRWGNARERIVVVRLDLLTDDEIPKILGRTEGYSFFGFDGKREAGYEKRFHRWGKVQDDRFYDEADELGGYLWRTSKQWLAKDFGPRPPPPTRNGRTVYLAKPAPDMVKSYEFLANNLVSQGFDIVPRQDQFVPLDSSASGFIDNAIALADTSIHILGNEAGYAPDGHDPLVKLQLERAALRASEDVGVSNTSHAFKRIIWAPKVIEDSSANEFRDPVTVIAKFDKLIPGDKLFGDGRSGFWGSLRQLLDRPGLHNDNDDRGPDQDSRIYIYHDQEDREFAFGIAKAFRDKGANYVLPAMQGNDVQRARLHKDYLRDCDAVILCWAQATDVWAKTSLNELRNWRDLGRTQKFRRRSLVLGPPPGVSKEPVALPPKDFDYLLNLIDGERPDPELLVTLLNGDQPNHP